MPMLELGITSGWKMCGERENFLTPVYLDREIVLCSYWPMGLTEQVQLQWFNSTKQAYSTGLWFWLGFTKIAVAIPASHCV